MVHGMYVGDGGIVGTTTTMLIEVEMKVMIRQPSLIETGELEKEKTSHEMRRRWVYHHHHHGHEKKLRWVF